MGKVPEEHKKKGIYAIRNKVNGKLYIGSTTVSFYERWHSNIVSLNKNIHGNFVLQKARY